MATSEQLSPAVRPKRRLSAGKFALLCVLCLLLLLAAVYAIGSLISSRQLRAELDKIRAAGEPVTAVDLDALYAYPPKDRDTTELWLDAFAVLDSPEFFSDAEPLAYVRDGKPAPPPGEPWPQFEAAEAFLAKYREPLEKMHLATEMGGEARYPERIEDESFLQVTHVASLQSAVRLLQLEAEVGFRRNDPHAVAQSVQAMLAAARTLEPQPLLASQMLRNAFHNFAWPQLELLLREGRCSEEDLTQLDRALAAVDEEAAFRRALLGQRVIGIRVFDNPRGLGSDVPEAHRLQPLHQVDETTFLKLMAKYISFANSNTLPLRDAIRLAHDELAPIMDSSIARWRYPIARYMAPNVLFDIDACCRAQAQQSIARTAIAIERYRRVHGSSPKTLDQLVPEFLDRASFDPFDQAPLRYQSDATGYKIYSIGPDGIDQGGEAGEIGQEFDIVFEVPFKARAGAGRTPGASKSAVEETPRDE